MRHCLWLTLALLAPAAGGCDALAWFGYVLAPPPPKKTVLPEYPGLEDQHVAVVIYASPATQLDYQTVQLELSDAIGRELTKRIDGITLVDPRRVMRYQDDNHQWDRLPPENLCRTFTCDYVLLVTLLEFSTREANSRHLARGRLLAEAGVYRTPVGGRGGCVWRAAEPIRITYPPDNTVGMPARDDYKVRARTETAFAEALVKRFYKHKVPIEP